uniref:Myostatin n=2 Tax=Lampea lactea TaxID=1403706 RepID=V9PPV6_9METZ|nr:myostatin [Lampea lactea]
MRDTYRTVLHIVVIYTYCFSVVLAIDLDDRSCPYSEIVERKRDAVKVQLLAKLNLRSLPNNTRNDIPADLRHQLSLIYRDLVHNTRSQLQQDGRVERHIDSAKRKLVFPNIGERLIQNTLYYKWTELNSGIVKKATLRMPLELDVPHLKIYIINENFNFRKVDKLRKRQVERVHVHKDLDVTVYYNKWVTNPNSNHGLLACIGRCYDETNSNSEVNLTFGGKPTIELSWENDDSPHANIRSKRYSSQVCSDFPKNCCYKSHYITFKEIGMDHIIIEPQQFNAGLCLGVCKEMWLEQFYHSVIMSHSDNKEHVCCSPAKLSDLEVLYYDHEKRDVRFMTLPTMLVEECGCK